MGNRFVLEARGDLFKFSLKGANDEVILTGGRYRSHSSALVGIEAVRTNAASDSRFDWRTADGGAAYFVLLASNGEVIGTSMLYSTAKACERGILAVKLHAPTASVDDETTRRGDRQKHRQHDLLSGRARPRAAYASTWQADRLSILSQRMTANLAAPSAHTNRTPSETPMPATAPELPYEAALRITLPEMKALGDSGLTPIDVDMASATAAVSGCLSKLKAMRSEIQTHLPTFNLERFDKIEQYTLALNQANAIYRNALVQRGSVAALGKEVAELHDRLLEDAQSLANHGLFDTKQLEACRRSPTYRGIATAVFTLVALFKAQWPSIESRTPVTSVFLQKAGNRALDLLGAVSAKEQPPIAVAEAQLLRQQAFTLFSRAYEDARCAVQYLRRVHGDAHEIAPSINTGAPRNSSPAPGEQTPEFPRAAPSTKEVAVAASDPAPGMRIKNPHHSPLDASYVS